MNIMWTADIRMKWRCDHGSCDCDLSNRKVSPKNVFGTSTGFEPIASALARQCSTNWAMKTQTVEGMRHMNIMWTSDIGMKWRCDYRTCDCDLNLIRLSAVHIIFICFIPFTGTMNSTNWPAPNVWVFIAQLVEHCSANAEVMGSNPVEASKTFFGFNCDCLNRNHKCDDHIFISIIIIIFNKETQQTQ